jgi:hypothetical protein
MAITPALKRSQFRFVFMNAENSGQLATSLPADCYYLAAYCGSGVLIARGRSGM